MSTLVGSGILLVRRRFDATGSIPSRILSPLKSVPFVAFLAGSLIGSFGSRIAEITAVWFMTELTQSPLLVSLVTTAFSLPGFVLALPAGALGDVVDRRRLLSVALGLSSISMAAMAMLTMRGLIGPVLLLAGSAVIGLFGAAISNTMDAVLPQIVKRKDFPAAIALTGFRYQLSRAVGPVLGGLLIATASIGHAFLFCAIAPFGLLAFCWGWRPEREPGLPAEQIRAALKTGLRYVRNAPRLQTVLIRLVAFIGTGSAMWALLPVYVRHHLGLNALHYGLLFGAFGLGGAFGSVTAYGLSLRVSEESALRFATVGFAVNLFLLPRVHGIFALAAVLFVGGVAWSTGMVGLKTAMQVAAPDWVRGRISAIYQFSLHGAVSVGSVVWGIVASYWRTPDTLQYAGLMMAVTLLLALRYRVSSIPAVTEDHPVPKLAPLDLPEALAQQETPLMISQEYRIDPTRSGDFELLMHEVGGIRRRTGATFWGLFVDVTVAGEYIEYFVVESGLDARRMHDRMTDPERELMNRAHSFHTNGPGPITHHHQMVCQGDTWIVHRPGR